VTYYTQRWTHFVLNQLKPSPCPVIEKEDKCEASSRLRMPKFQQMNPCRLRGHYQTNKHCPFPSPYPRVEYTVVSHFAWGTYLSFRIFRALHRWTSVIANFRAPFQARIGGYHRESASFHSTSNWFCFQIMLTDPNVDASIGRLRPFRPGPWYPPIFRHQALAMTLSALGSLFCFQDFITLGNGISAIDSSSASPLQSLPPVAESKSSTCH